MLFVKRRPPFSRRTLKRFVRRCLIALAVLAAILIIEEIDFQLRTPNVRSQGPNALWIRHHWVGNRHTEANYGALAGKLKRLGVTDAFFHVGPLRADGTVDPTRIRYARRMIAHMRKLAPNVRIQAYLGQVTTDGEGPLDLSKPSIRHSVINTAMQFLDMGFDGIHYDIEPIHSGNEGFITLLQDTHRLTDSREAVLSAAVPNAEPFPGTERVVRLIARNTGYWSKSYFRRVSRELDQVAVMTYDSAIPLPGLYGRSIAGIVKWSKHNGAKTLFIGIPTYDNVSASHWPWIENEQNAIRGLRRGIEALDIKERQEVGASIFAEWTTQPNEIRNYQKEWLQAKQEDYYHKHSGYSR